MASVNYNQGVPGEAPQTSVPDDYQNVQPRAAEGLAAFGEGATKAATFFGQVAADNAFNNFQDSATKILSGDPSKQTLGPDGLTMQPDTGYLGTKGRAALDARPGVEKSLDDLIKQTQAGLQTPEQRLQFDTASRRYRAAAAERIGSHADEQAGTWYGEVNAASEKNALDLISNNPTDPNSVATGASDLINAAVKQAQLAGAKPGDPVYQSAIDGAKIKALKAQVQAVAATDPAAAQRILVKNKNIAGVEFAPLYEDLKQKADKQNGLAFSTTVLSGQKAAKASAASTWIGNPAQPVYRSAAAAVTGGMSSGGLARTVQIESGGNANITNASGHVGLGQFSAETWKAYGGGGDPKNPQDAIMAIQRYAAANSRYLTPRIGRPPTDAELYLAHQQGPGGAAKLLTNPNALAVNLVGRQAVLGNGGTANMTAAQFTSMWTHKFDGTAPAGTPYAGAAGPGGAAPAPGEDASRGTAPVGGAVPIADVSAAPGAPGPNPLPSGDVAGAPSAKASAYQAIQSAVDAGTLTPAAAQYAYEDVNRQLAAQQIAEDATATQVKQANDKAAGGYMTTILTGGSSPALLDQVANDPNLMWETKESLTRAAQEHANNTVSGASAAYGPGFWSAYQQITAPVGDPSRVSDMSSLLRRAGPGGDLTLDGVQKLGTVMAQATRSVDDQAVVTTKGGLLAYAKSRLSFQQDTGPVQIKDPQGEQLFQSRFIPKFEAAYDNWVKGGKDPWQFLTQENVDKLMTGLRSPKEMALARIEASANVDTSQITVPAPAGVDEDGWKSVLAVPMVSKGGRPWSTPQWAAAVARLQQNPSKDVQKQFDDNFANAPVSAADILDILRPQGMTEAQAAEVRRDQIAGRRDADAPGVAAGQVQTVLGR